MRMETGVERDTPQRATLNPLGAPVELIATVLLALSTVVAVTAVSIGIARADVLGGRADIDVAPFAIALMLGLLFSTVGGLAAIMTAHNGK